jgi:precorrin-6Y C5,15-methyltransferase (decarboxylating)
MVTDLIGGAPARLTLVGLDGRPLSPDAAVAVATATLVVGAERHLLSAGVGRGARTVALGDLGSGLDALAGHDGPAVVLASGDPGFFGIVRALRRRGHDPVVHPAVSSVALAAARVGIPWDDVAVTSAHGREMRPALNACRALPRVAVLTAPGAGPAELGAGLEGWPRTFVVAERLGMPGGRVVELPAADAVGQHWADPNVVLCTDPARPADPGPRWVAGADPGPAGWALPEDRFAHRDAMVTKAEVRALALARLGPRLGDLVWDVGSGSGSVGVECARLGAAVVAVDKDAAAAEHTAVNACAHGVSVRVETGVAPEALADLPDPDGVFVGGGGVAVVAACAVRARRVVVVALAALDRVGPVRDVLAAAGLGVAGVQLSAARLTDLPDGTSRLAATNPVVVLTGERP